MIAIFYPSKSYQFGRGNPPFFTMVEHRGLSAAYSLGQVGARQAWLDWLPWGKMVQICSNISADSDSVVQKKQKLDMVWSIKFKIISNPSSALS